MHQCNSCICCYLEGWVRPASRMETYTVAGTGTPECKHTDRGPFLQVTSRLGFWARCGPTHTQAKQTGHLRSSDPRQALCAEKQERQFDTNKTKKGKPTRLDENSNLWSRHFPRRCFFVDNLSTLVWDLLGCSEAASGLTLTGHYYLACSPVGSLVCIASQQSRASCRSCVPFPVLSKRCKPRYWWHLMAILAILLHCRAQNPL